MKLSFLLLVFVILIITAGCNSQEINELQAQNDKLIEQLGELKQNYDQLEKEKKQLEDAAIPMKEEIERFTSQQELADAVSRQVDSFSRTEIQLYKQYITDISSEVSDKHANQGMSLLNLYNPAYLKQGDVVAGLEVGDVRREFNEATQGTSDYVHFKGQFTVRGTVGLNQVSSPAYYVCIVDDELEKLPHTVQQLESGQLCFLVENEEQFEAALQDDLEQLTHSNPIPVKATFSTYRYQQVPGTDVLSMAVFEKILEQ